MAATIPELPTTGFDFILAMGFARDLLVAVLPWALPFVGISLALTIGLWIIRTVNSGGDSASQSRRQLLQILLVLVAVVALPLFLPLDNELRGQLLSLLGLLFSAILGLSSTTFVANAMAGFMQRSVTSFAPGDFISVGDTFGRVTERALLHTELQTEDRDLVTLPNLYLINHPVKVVRSTGTLVAATVSLGYDVPRAEVNRCLLAAAEAAGLEEPFVQVLELGDFSVLYRVAGFLAEVRRLVSRRSELKAQMLDALHGAGIEIVSPGFMNQRPLDPAVKMIPDGQPDGRTVPQSADRSDAERLMFDKADGAARLADFVRQRDELQAQIKALSDGSAEGVADKAPATVAAELELRRRELAFIERILAALDGQPAA